MEQDVNLKKIKEWSSKERKEDKYNEFEYLLKQKKNQQLKKKRKKLKKLRV